MMKKRFFCGFAVVAIAAMAAWNVSFSSKADGMSDIMLANVEALANNEDDDCSDGRPRLSCAIWHVFYAEGNGGNISCTTGGPWKCDISAR